MYIALYQYEHIYDLSVKSSKPHIIGINNKPAATGIGTPIKKLFLISSFSLSLFCTLNLASRNAEQAI